MRSATLAIGKCVGIGYIATHILFKLNSECIHVIDFGLPCMGLVDINHITQSQRRDTGVEESLLEESGTLNYTPLYTGNTVAGTFWPCMWLEKLLSERESEMKRSQ